MPFFKTFSCVFLRFFKSFLPAFSSFSQRFPQFSLFFSKLAIYCSLHFYCFFNIFLHFLQPFATPFLGITPHPLANRLAPNPNGRYSPLSSGSLVFSICLPLCSYSSFFKALPCLHFMPFFQTFSCVPTVFPNFLPAISSFPNGFLNFLGFSKLAIHFFLQFNVFSQVSSIFLHFPLFQRFSFNFLFFPTFFFPFSGDLGRTTVTKLPSGTCPPKKIQLATLITTRYQDFGPLGQPPPPILTLFAKTTLPSLSAGFRNKTNYIYIYTIQL